MSARPLVRSTSWSGTTTVPGPVAGSRLPTAHGPNTRRTPSLRSAHMLARYGTVCAENSWAAPCRGRNATSCPATAPIVTGALGLPYGVSTVTERTSDSKKV